MKNIPKATGLFNACSIILILATLLQTMPSYGRKFYFSSTLGNDNNTVTQAQNPATPWRSLRRLQNFGNSGLAAAGDTFAFRSGEVFSNGRDEFGSLKWWSINGFRCPSGSARNPIVFTSYGTGAKPNFLFPSPSITVGRNRIVMAFDGVNYIVLDGLQFSDNRFPVNDKVSTALTSMGILLGEDGLNSKTNNSVIKNCQFNNIGSGISMSGNNNRIENNVFTNFKNYGDTSGNTDVGAIPIILMSGKYNRVTNNYIQGGWAYTAATASGAGLNGVGIEIMNDFDSSFIGYNTIIDCAGGMEIGNNTGLSTIGANEDTIAYNQFINNGVLCYAATTGTFSSRASKIRVWNNVYVENGNSRFSGPRFGQDIFSDGQSFTSFPSWPAFPQNSSTSNFGGFRILQYPIDSENPLDTLYDSRNNVFWMTNRNQALYGPERVRYKRANNIYHIVGQAVLGGVLNGGNQIEINTSARIFRDTIALNPAQWIFNIAPTSQAWNFGRSVRLTRDFFNNSILGNPDAGIHELQVLPLSIQVNAPTVSCFGDSVNVQVTAIGGVPPYTGTGTFRRNAGSYIFSVTDSFGAIVSSIINILQPSRIQTSATFTPIIEFGATTSVTMQTTGGISPYRFSINGGTTQSDSVFSGVPAGSHVFTVQDLNACSQSVTLNINQPAAPFQISATADSIRCNGDFATIQISATGGTPPYRGLGSFQRSAGSHQFSVLDSNGVMRTTTVVLTEPDSLQLLANFPPISNFGGNTTVTLNGNGGRSPFRFSWNNGSFQSNNVISPVVAGIYSIALTDSNNCSINRTLLVTQPALTPISLNPTFSPITCRGGSTTLTIAATGGLPPYTGTGSFVRTAGTYSFTVGDAAGQTQAISVSLTEPSLALFASLSAGTIATFGGSTTLAVQSVIGGQAPYRFSLNGGALQTSNSFFNVLAGDHRVTIVDSLGCSIVRTTTIRQPVQISILSFTNNTCRWVWDGTITVGALGGTPPYLYRINNFGYNRNNVFLRLGPGTYTLQVMDATGSTSSTTATILASTVICQTAKSNEVNIEQKGTDFFLFPNPSRNGFQIANLEKSGLVEVDVHNVNGIRLANYSTMRTVGHFGSHLSPGLYFIRGRKKDQMLTGYFKWIKLP